MTDRRGVRRRLSTLDPSWLAVPVGVVAAAVVALYAPLPTETATMLAITVFSISLWVGTPVAPWVTGLVAVGLIGVAFSTELALVGFRSAATWLIVLGVLLGEATRRSGLGTLVERAVLGEMPARLSGDAVATYRYLLVVLSAAAFALAVLVPSALVRVLILGPILVSVGERFTDRRTRLGVFLGPLFVTYYGGTGVFTGSLVNVVVAGIVEANAGIRLGWVEWGLWMGPVAGVGRAVAVVGVAYLLYRPTDPSAVVAGDPDDPDDPDDPVELGADQRRMLLFLLVGVAVWATDALHGLHPLYGALVVVLLAVAPRIGVVTSEEVTDVDVSIVFFVGAIFAIAEGLQRTAFTELAARSALSLLPADAGLPLVLGVVVVAAVGLTFVVEGLAAASVLTPVLVSFATSAGLPVEPVAMIEAVALSTYFFPYQSVVLVAILGLDVVDPVELVRMTTACSVATLIVVIPVQIGVFALAF